MIIDCHCHAGKGDKMTAPWNTDAPMETHLRRSRAAGIDKTIVLAPLHGNYEQANRQVAGTLPVIPKDSWDLPLSTQNAMPAESSGW